MLVPLMIAASIMQASPTGPGQGQVRLVENARVIHVTKPSFVSGTWAVYADFDIVVPGAAPMRMYVLWMTMNQYLPDVGSICTIRYRSEPLVGGNLHNHPDRSDVRDANEPHNVVQDLSCGPPLEQPRRGQRSPIAS